MTTTNAKATADTPTADTLTAGMSTADMPATSAPTTDAPTASASTTDMPAADMLTTGAPTASAPAAGMPAAGALTADAPGVSAPGVGALAASEPRARFRDLLASEWIKLRSLRSTWIAYGATALAVIGINAGIAYDTYSHWTQQASEDRGAFVRDGIPLSVAFDANALMIMMLALGAMGALMIIGEYSTGTIRTTFAAVPARRSVMAAKALVLTAVTAAFGAFVATASFALTQLILEGRDVGVPLSHPGALRVVLASALLAPVSALVGMALGAVLRNTAATMVTSGVLLLVLPIAFGDDGHWQAVVGHATLYQAWIRIVEVGFAPSPFPWTSNGAWTVYAVWALAAAVIAIISVHRRDQLSDPHVPSPQPSCCPDGQGHHPGRRTRNDRALPHRRKRPAEETGGGIQLPTAKADRCAIAVRPPCTSWMSREEAHQAVHLVGVQEGAHQAVHLVDVQGGSPPGRAPRGCPRRKPAKPCTSWASSRKPTKKEPPGGSPSGAGRGDVRGRDGHRR